MNSRIQTFGGAAALSLLVLMTGCAHRQAAPVLTVQPAPKPEVSQMSPRINHWSAEWTPLFDDATLSNWAATDFGGHGKVEAQPGQINIGAGEELSGISWTNGTLPKTDYEISLDAMKVDGGDFFCGLTFPVADSWCSLIVGGWGGGLVGLSSLDDNDASENETTKNMNFPRGQWYTIRVRVTPARIQAWIDQEKLIDVSIVGRKVSVRPGSIYLSEPLGVATYETSAAVRNIKLRLIEN